VDVITIGPLPGELGGRGVQNVVVTVNGESSNAVTVRIPD
jgi:hypothetical protein